MIGSDILFKMQQKIVELHRVMFCGEHPQTGVAKQWEVINYHFPLFSDTRLWVYVPRY